jgi:uncharacterized membrane protein
MITAFKDHAFRRGFRDGLRSIVTGRCEIPHRAVRREVGSPATDRVARYRDMDDLDRYAAHVPDAAERLLAAGEREQAHGHRVEGRLAATDAEVVLRYFAGQRRAHVIGLILGLSYLGAMVLAILQGYPLAGVGGATFGIAAVIWAIRREPSASGSDD